MAEVTWSDGAFEDLSVINRFIRRHSLTAADQVATRIVEGTRRLELFPATGRIVPEFDDQDTREVIVDSYRVISQYGGGDVHILAVRHAAQRLTTLAEL